MEMFAGKEQIVWRWPVFLFLFEGRRNNRMFVCWWEGPTSRGNGRFWVPELARTACAFSLSYLHTPLPVLVWLLWSSAAQDPALLSPHLLGCQWCGFKPCLPPDSLLSMQLLSIHWLSQEPHALFDLGVGQTPPSQGFHHALHTLLARPCT